jgi:hypothetical protein
MTKAQWKTTTKWVMIGIIILIAVYDLVALAVAGRDATISRVVGIEGSFDSPLIPFGVGFIMGHLFWPQPQKAKKDK